MQVIQGKYILTIKMWGAAHDSDKTIASFQGLKNTDYFEGKFDLDGKKNYVAVTLSNNGIELNSENKYSRSRMVFNLTDNTGMYECFESTISGTQTHKLKLISYDYNNNHFMIQYVRLFQEIDEAFITLEVMFND